MNNEITIILTKKDIIELIDNVKDQKNTVIAFLEKLEQKPEINRLQKLNIKDQIEVNKEQIKYLEYIKNHLADEPVNMTTNQFKKMKDSLEN